MLRHAIGGGGEGLLAQSTHWELRGRIPTKALAPESATLCSSVRWASKDAVLTRRAGPGLNAWGCLRLLVTTMVTAVGQEEGLGWFPRGVRGLFLGCVLFADDPPRVMKPRGERAKPWPTGWARVGPGWEVWGRTRARGRTQGPGKLGKGPAERSPCGPRDAWRWWEFLQQVAPERPEELT